MSERFELLNFRNYRHPDIEFLPRRNLVTGRDAQGKSNLLGSIYFLSYLRSKRAARLADLVGEGTEKASVLGIIMVNGCETKVKLTFGQGGRAIGLSRWRRR
jgi:DNA replication and repair protein RecF